jgi:ATP-dependent Clp protease ATP-binding subunit ClpC
MASIVTLLAKNLAARCKKQMSIDLSFSPSLKKHLVEKYADYKMGARPLKRAIQNVVEDALAEEILIGKIKSGDKILVTYKKDEIIFEHKD